MGVRTKESLELNEWMRDLAPSPVLRKWFGHEPKRWDAFRARYQSELSTDVNQERLRQLLTKANDANSQSITLIFGAKDKDHNQAVVLRDVLQDLQDQ
jgi:uncharacterized protein YeaO (DUF488 family)